MLIEKVVDWLNPFSIYLTSVVRLPHHLPFTQVGFLMSVGLLIRYEGRFVLVVFRW